MSLKSLISGRGPAFFASKAGARWLITLIVAISLCSVIYVYHSDANTALLKLLLPNAKPDQPGKPIPEFSSSTPGVLPPTPPHGTHHHTRPAWIDTPAVYDTSQLTRGDYTPTSALPDRPLALHPLLSSAVARFLARPVLTHSQARPQNEAACPRSQLDRQVNADQLRDEQAGWLAVDATRVVEMRAGALEYLEGRSGAEGEDALVGPGKTSVTGGPDVGQQDVAVEKGSRGVVLAAGNHRTVQKAVMCIKELQRLGWTGGGIEVFHFEGEMTDGNQRRELEELGVTIRMVRGRLSAGFYLPRSCIRSIPSQNTLLTYSNTTGLN